MTDATFNEQALAAARNRFYETGTTVHAWAMAHGVSPSTVYEVLSGRRRCCRGDAHRVAVALGLKPAPSQQATTVCSQLHHST
ncbi:helix-turn-helix domain-containing protein [Perlucidibaca piscinae]|uniref:hypothetical protein n=1 Tax=Perlucidibaca piscinae TaxID=392589 RepID=UPI0003B7A18F|nr:hypothetical protein [Perlucidibaca piscinae]